jgi:hypothetical protein
MASNQPADELRRSIRSFKLSLILGTASWWIIPVLVWHGHTTALERMASLVFALAVTAGVLLTAPRMVRRLRNRLETLPR